MWWKNVLKSNTSYVTCVRYRAWTNVNFSGIWVHFLTFHMYLFVWKSKIFLQMTKLLAKSHYQITFFFIPWWDIICPVNVLEWHNSKWRNVVIQILIYHAIIILLTFCVVVLNMFICKDKTAVQDLLHSDILTWSRLHLLFQNYLMDDKHWNKTNFKFTIIINTSTCVCWFYKLPII